MAWWHKGGLALGLLAALCLAASPVPAQTPARKPALEQWKPGFDPAKAKYKLKVGCAGHPALKAVQAGFAIRDALWKETGGQVYFEFLPLSVLGGEVEVLNQLQMGAIQGMAVSSAVAPNLGPRMGLVNLPFLVDSFERLEKLAGNEKLYAYFLDGMRHQGILGLEVTSYGQYGWATSQPVTTLEEARRLKFRIAEAPIAKLAYKAWGLNPLVIPWPDVAEALGRGVVEGLDHTPLVCQVERKFEHLKHFTGLNYAQGLLVWVFGERWFNTLPEDLQKAFRRVVREQAAHFRAQARAQQAEAVKAAQKEWVAFHELAREDLLKLRELGGQVHQEYAPTLGAEYLKQVQDFLGYGTEPVPGGGLAAPEKPRGTPTGAPGRSAPARSGGRRP